jgi:hypothetical protein
MSCKPLSTGELVWNLTIRLGQVILGILAIALCFLVWFQVSVFIGHKVNDIFVGHNHTTQEAFDHMIPTSRNVTRHINTFWLLAHYGEAVVGELFLMEICFGVLVQCVVAIIIVSIVATYDIVYVPFIAGKQSNRILWTFMFVLGVAVTLVLIACLAYAWHTMTILLGTYVRDHIIIITPKDGPAVHGYLTEALLLLFGLIASILWMLFMQPVIVEHNRRIKLAREKKN